MESKKRDIKEAESKISRRFFISSSAAAVASLTIVPRHVLGGPGNISPSEKLNIAGIGVGGREVGISTTSVMKILSPFAMWIQDMPRVLSNVTPGQKNTAISERCWRKKKTSTPW